MVFSSLLFLFCFLPIVLLLYYAFNNKTYRHILLTLTSYLFYGWTNPLFVFLLLFSTFIDYVCGLVMMGYPHLPRGGVLLQRGAPRSRRQRIALIISIVSNLSLLGFFKYVDFGIENWNQLMVALNASDTFLLPALHILLPLGISFYTFQSMSYSIDVYRGDAQGVTSFIDFACYVSMFPQLVAGPIIRFQEVAAQLNHRTYSWEKFARGIAFFVLGMGQKILLANPCGKIADFAFQADSCTPFAAWWSLISYSFQIFFDFSGYSNMAIGLGLMLGFIFPKNFEYPYRSFSITEFWRRWHISLSTWLRDYLYIPLGGNRKGAVRTYVNLLLVMLLGGLWHGASWNFVIWGAIHGVVLVIERYTGISRHQKMKWIHWLYTYFVVLIAWVFFRAEDLPGALNYLSAMFGLQSSSENVYLTSSAIFDSYHLFFWIVSALFVALAPDSWSWTRVMGKGKWITVMVIFLLSIIVLTVQSYNPFIYFIF